MTTAALVKALRESTEQAENWNRDHSVGTDVDVTLDNGEILTTRTRSEAWVLDSGDAVILVEGIRGGYLLSRVRAK